jgi:hypothetical protein
MAPLTLAGLVTQIRERLPTGVFNRAQLRGADSGARGGGRVSGGRCVRVAQQYMVYRQQGRVEELLRLVSDDVALDSSRDGRYHGKGELEQYFRRIKPRGMWEPATWNARERRAEIHGVVRILRWNVKVLAHFGFNGKGEINRIYVGVKDSKKSRRR